MFPELLYQPTAYDYQTGANARRYYDSREGTFAGVNSALLLQPTIIEPNRALVLHNLFLNVGADVAGAEQITEIAMRRLFEGVVVGWIKRARSFVGLGQNVSIEIPTPIVLLPGEGVSFFAEKSAAIQTFRMTYVAVGFLIPRANIQSG